MKEIVKHCDTCFHACYESEKDLNGGDKLTRLQHCGHPVYRSPAYTNKMLLEDWGKGHCRFWTPIPEKGTDHEKQLLSRSAKCPCGS